MNIYVLLMNIEEAIKIEQLLEQINSNSIKKIILDTDTYNEVDDQFV